MDGAENLVKREAEKFINEREKNYFTQHLKKTLKIFSMKKTGRLKESAVF